MSGFSSSQIAETVPFDNTGSGLTSTTVQDAILELASGSPVTPMATKDTTLDILRIEADGILRISMSRLLRIISTGNSFVNTITKLVKIEAAGSTVITAGSVLRISN